MTICGGSMTGKTGRREGRERRTGKACSADLASCGRSGPVLPSRPSPPFSVLPAFAQTDSRLVDAIRQAQEGEGDSARAQGPPAPSRDLAEPIPSIPRSSTPRRWWRAMPPTCGDSSSGLRSNTPPPAGPMTRSCAWSSSTTPAATWTGAARNLERHPPGLSRQHAAAAVILLGGAHLLRSEESGAGLPLDRRWARRHRRGNVELQNQLGYLDQRCAGLRPISRSRTATDSQPGQASGGTDTAALPPERTDSAPAPASAAPPTTTSGSTCGPGAAAGTPRARLRCRPGLRAPLAVSGFRSRRSARPRRPRRSRRGSKRRA